MSLSRFCAQAACAALAFCLIPGALRAQQRTSTPVVICEGTQALKTSKVNLETQAQTAAKPSTITLTHRPAADATSATNSQKIPPTAPQTISLTVPPGTPIQVVLAKQVRIRKVGQLITGRVGEAIYSFDKLVIPTNSEVIGKITGIQAISRERRAEGVLNADFTPAHTVDVAFSALVLPDGRRIPIRTKVTPGSGEVIEFVSATGDQNKGLTGEVSKKKKEAERQAHQQWDAALGAVKAPGKVQRLKRYALAQLPFHPQYIKSGTVYFAELRSPLDFGSEPLTPALAQSIAHPELPQGSVVEARLLTPLNSRQPIGAIR